MSIAVAGTDHLTLLAFLTSGCLTCSVFWDAFADPGLEVPGDARLVIVTKGERAESPTSVYRLAPDSVPVVMSDDAWEAYDVPVAPFFVLIDGETSAVVGEGAAQQLGAGHVAPADRARRRRPARSTRAARSAARARA